MDQEERLALEHRLTKIEETLNKITDILSEISKAFKGHTHPEIDRDYAQIKYDLNEIGQKVHRVNQDAVDTLREFNKEITAEREKNLDQGYRIDQLEKKTKWFETKFWSTLGTLCAGAGVIIWQYLTKK